MKVDDLSPQLTTKHLLIIDLKTEKIKMTREVSAIYEIRLYFVLIHGFHKHDVASVIVMLANDTSSDYAIYGQYTITMPAINRSPRLTNVMFSVTMLFVKVMDGFAQNLVYSFI